MKTEKPMVYDDPIWEFLVRDRMKPYITAARKWWKSYESISVHETGVYPANMEDAPGMMFRFTKSAAKSPIKCVQVFPFVPVAYLQISGVAGGSTKMVQRVCSGGLKMDEFTVVEKHNLPSTYNQGQFLAIIPTEVYEGAKIMGRFVYLNVAQIESLSQGILPPEVIEKAQNCKNLI